MLDLAILGLLKEQDLHGYELKKRLSGMLGVMSPVSFGSLYPALARLEKAGSVRTVAPSAPAGDVKAQKSRKVYAITPAGEATFVRLLASESASLEDGRMFHLRLAFARYLPTDARIAMLERRRAQLLERLSSNRDDLRTRAGRRADAYVRSLIEHEQESTEHDLGWIERLLAGERPSGGSDTLPPPLPPPPSSSRPTVPHRRPMAPTAAGFRAFSPRPAPSVGRPFRRTGPGTAPTLSGLRPERVTPARVGGAGEPAEPHRPPFADIPSA